MSSELVSIRRHGDVLDVVLDRPDNGNRLNAAMSTAIIDAVSHLDDTVKLVRLRSSGADFCTGRESPMPAADSRPSAETLRRIVAAPPLELYDALKAVRVPVLAIVRGRAIGVGCALAGVCDLPDSRNGTRHSADAGHVRVDWPRAVENGRAHGP
jgi:enoyl-CoA hydratase